MPPRLFSLFVSPGTIIGTVGDSFIVSFIKSYSRPEAVLKLEAPQSFAGVNNCYGFLNIPEKTLIKMGQIFIKDQETELISFEIDEEFVDSVGDICDVPVRYEVCFRSNSITRTILDTSFGINEADLRIFMFGAKNAPMIREFMGSLSLGYKYFNLIKSKGSHKVGDWKTVAMRHTGRYANPFVYN